MWINNNVIRRTIYYITYVVVNIENIEDIYYSVDNMNSTVATIINLPKPQINSVYKFNRPHEISSCLHNYYQFQVINTFMLYE